MPAIAVLAAVADDAVVPLRALRAGAAGRHPGRPRDPAGDAHPQALRRRRGRPRRPEDAGLAGAHLRLPRRARRLHRLPAAAGAAARPDPHRRLLRPDERRRRGLGALALSRRAARPRRASARLRADDRRARLGVRLRRPRHHLGRRPLLRRPRDLQRDERLPARRRHREPRRRAPLPQRQPAVPLARRVPLPRSARPPGAFGGQGAPRRVLVLGGGDGMAAREILKYPSVEKRHAGRARPAHDAALLDHAAAARPQPRFAAARRSCTSSTPTPSLARAARRDVRRDRRRLPRPDQLLDRQALHHDLLRAGRHAPFGQRLRGDPDDLAADRAQELLDRRDDARGRRPDDDAVPRARAELRRVGLHHRQPAAVPRCRRCCRPTCAFSTSPGLPALFQFPPDMARVPTEVNRLSNQVLVQTFDEEWGKVAR